MKVRQFFKSYNDPDNLYDSYYVGKLCGGNVIVSQIEYHEPQGEGDAHYCDVIYSDGCKTRIFRPDSIDFFKDGAVWQLT